MIDRFLLYLMHQKRYSPNTVEAYRRDLEQFAKYIGSQEEWHEVHPTDIRSWLLLLLKEGQSIASVHRKISTLKSYYKYLIQTGNTKQNPVAGLSVPKREKRLPTFLKEKQTRELFQHIEFPSNFEGTRDRLILQMFYGTGMRVSELVMLKEMDVDVSQKILKVLGKRRKERIIPLLPVLIDEITEYVSLRNKEIGLNHYLFVTQSNVVLNRGQVYYIVKKYLGQVSTVMKRSPHILRHTFATQMLNNGADINALKEFLGHSSLSATQIYTHNTREQLKKDYKQAHPRA